MGVGFCWLIAGDRQGNRQAQTCPLNTLDTHSKTTEKSDERQSGKARKARAERQRDRESPHSHVVFSFICLSLTHNHTLAHPHTHTHRHTPADRQRASKAKNVFITYATCCPTSLASSVCWGSKRGRRRSVQFVVIWHGLYPTKAQAMRYAQLLEIFENSKISCILIYLSKCAKWLRYSCCFAFYSVSASRALSRVHRKFACFVCLMCAMKAIDGNACENGRPRAAISE